MNYLDFLGEWYNIAFVSMTAAGMACAGYGRLRGRDLFGWAAGLIAAGVVGLTWNGAIHDLALGSPAPRFPLVLLVSAAIGVLFGQWAARFRNRHFRPIRGVSFNRPGHEEVEALIVSRDTGPEPGSGRAQWQDERGTLHLVHVHTSGEGLGFGTKVRLVQFDAETESYLAVQLPRKGRWKGDGRGEDAPPRPSV